MTHSNGKRFDPRFYFCADGNHFHLLTGLYYGASPAFVSLKAGEYIIDSVTNQRDDEDVSAALRLKQELKDLRLQRGRRRGRLYTHLMTMEHASIPHWKDFLNEQLDRSEVDAHSFFTQTPCDFIGRCLREGELGSQELSLRPIKVREVLSST